MFALVHSVLSCQVLKDGWHVGAAVLGVPAKATIKEVGIFLAISSLFPWKNNHICLVTFSICDSGK